jgi:choline dehydrogenase-like flavoprotein
MQSSPASSPAQFQASPRTAFADAETFCVVGSGPAGVACASALLEKGRKVLMLDAGITLEPERLPLVEKFKRTPPENWMADDLARYQAGMNSGASGVPLKLVYGSDFAYRETDQHLRVEYERVGLRPSLAEGGLSNVWGAAMLPYLQADIADWPFQVDALAEHYAAALRLTGLAAVRDSLSDFFPLYTNEATNLRLSRQSERLLQNLERNRGVLDRAGIRFGQSRLAVRGKSATEEGCVHCRLCMYGCPYDYIYRSSHNLAALAKEPRFAYQGGVIVRTVQEREGLVEISGYDRVSRKPLSWQCSRVFLAAGAIPTTQILLRSQKAYDQPVWLKDSQYFLAPLLLLKKVKGATEERAHGLSQIFFEMMREQGQGVAAHIQIYSNSDLVSQAIAASFGPLRGPLGFLVRELQERMLVAQGFLHSNESGRIRVMLKRGSSLADARGSVDAGGFVDRLELRAERNPETARLVRRAVARLLKQTGSMGAAPLLPMLKIAELGRSFHAGGSFPMSKDPSRFQTDLLGRPAGWERVHAVDATVFPSVPATTITFSVMANAHRIGCAAAALSSAAEPRPIHAFGSYT